MPISDPQWPPDEYQADFFPPPWLRLGRQYPGSGRPSRLVEHAAIPYIADIDGEDAANTLPESLKTVASRYLNALSRFMEDDDILMPEPWRAQLASPTGTAPPTSDAAATIRWLNIWPPWNAPITAPVPSIASWNLSRNEHHALPAPIVMVATEFYTTDGSISGFDSGVRVPMDVEVRGTENRPVYRVIVRSMTAEFPSVGRQSATELLETVDPDEFPDFGDALVGGMTQRAIQSDMRDHIAAKAGVSKTSIRHNQISFMRPAVARNRLDPITLRLSSQALRPSNKPPEPESFQVLSDIRFSPGKDPELIRSQTCALTTHAALPGEAMVFAEVPSSSPKHLGAGNIYNWVQRRPARKDDILMRFRTARDFARGVGLRLQQSGFQVRLCPWYVPADDALSNAGETVKSVHLNGGQAPLPRRNDFSALSAYANSLDFFEMMSKFGHPPDTFVTRAQQELQVFYRSGISPGPGRSGRTINAQVTFNCQEQSNDDDAASPPPPKPYINMHLALANLNRFSRPKNDDGTFGRPEPLGISVSGRWMMHEFGHYLLAARIGKLEFDFAHSAGDAMAAIYFDPRSSLNRATEEISTRFRGITYPFVFAPRRHDRSPLTGWAWYGLLNRAILQAPPADCHVTKGYLTEQILSSTLFRLYRSLGGDTLRAGVSDVEVRKRAAHITLFLLVRAIAGLAQSPSRAEMLELGMEDASRQMQVPLTMPDDVANHPVWRGGQAQKVVRWAFEAQGMFPNDPEVVVNKAGQPPRVDIYVKDDRPEQVRTPAGRETYDPGSYTPVSLNWEGERLWSTPSKTVFHIGNRGAAPSGPVLARFWLGRVPIATPSGQVHEIDWTHKSAFHPVPASPPQDSFDLDLPELEAALQNQPPNSTHQRVVLLEISCQADIANTFPLSNVMVSIPPHQDPPTHPRSLIDLVSGDNNLGLMFRD